MNILNLLTKEKRVAGIEISDSVVRIAFLRERALGRRRKALAELVLIEEPTPANIIVEGVVADPDLLGKTLKAMWHKAALGTDYAIVAIPDDKIYSRIFSFPKTVEGERLTEAMRLAIGFQIPVNPEDAYLDWERVGGTMGSNEILLSTIPRAVAQGYVEALESAGIKTLALESHLAAIARAIKIQPGQTTIFTKKTPDGATVFALKDGILRFSRTLPARFVTESAIETEVEHIRTAIEAEAQKSKQASIPIPVMPLLEAKVRDEYTAYPEIASQRGPVAKWLIALGTLMRGKIPEGQDNLISLLPVGTEEAYSYQKATTFIALVRNMTVGISVFFIAAFLFAYLFVLSLSQSADRQIATLSASAISPELAAKEVLIGNVNALSATAQTIISQTPLWSAVLDEVDARIINGIVVTSFSASSMAEKMSLQGISRDRATLNQFKKVFQGSPMFSEVELPIANLEQESDIPFSISFRVKEPAALYYH